MQELLASLDEFGLIPTKEDVVRLKTQKKPIEEEFPFAQDLLKTDNWVIESCWESIGGNVETILFKVKNHINSALADFCRDTKAKLPKNIEEKKKFSSKKNYWELNLSGRLNRNFRLFIRRSLQWSVAVYDMGDRLGYKVCTYAARARDAFIKKYPDLEVYNGEPFYNYKLELWFIEIPKGADRDKFNKFIKNEYKSKDNQYTEISPGC